MDSTKGRIYTDADVEYLGVRMSKWAKGKEVLPDNSALPELVTMLLALQHSKEIYYGSSWSGKGEYRGVVSNLDRKYDRLDKIITGELQGTIPVLTKKEYKDLTEEEKISLRETKIDSVADLASYSLLYLSYLKKTYPGAFEVWRTRNILPEYDV